MNTSYRKFIPALLLVAAVVVLLIYPRVWPEAPYSSPDTSDYVSIANTLAHGGQFTDAPFRPFGYPLFMVLTGSTDQPTRTLFYAQLVLYLLAVCVLVGVLAQLRVSTRLIIGFIVVTTLPFMAQNTRMALTETVSAFYLAVGVGGLVFWLYRPGRWRVLWLVAACLVIAVAGITRPVYQLLALVLAVLMLVVSVRRRRDAIAPRLRIASAGLVAAAVLIVGGQALYNSSHFGYFGVTTLLGYNLSTKTWSFVDTLPDSDATVRAILVDTRNSVLLDNHISTEMYIWYAIEPLEKATGLDFVHLSNRMMTLNLKLIAGSPDEYLKAVLRSLVIYWMPSTDLKLSPNILNMFFAAIQGVLNVVFLWGLVILVSAAGLVFVIPRSVRPSVWRLFTPPALAVLALVATIIVYTTAISVTVEAGYTRYREPTDLLILLFVVVSIDMLLKARKQAFSAAPREQLPA